MAIGVGLVVLALVVLTLARGCSGANNQPGPPAGPSSSETTEGTTAPEGSRISLGVELLAGPGLRFHIPVCPGAVVIDATLVYPSVVSDGVWTVEATDPAPVAEVLVGEETPGFRTVTAFDGDWGSVLREVLSLASATRRADGRRLPPANLAFALGDLREGEIAYQRRDSTPLEFAGSATEFQAAVAPDCALR